ncbi:hypothetical protein [Nostoc sp. FACHB-110]|uniref:hypothetical protein n=1 Tax=Nostoc sp. FACHB-110 TaxID=2692834 RepID=UPI001683AC2D|nr:hypothetical protein [Nostoc sp. FACHB-110]MBD2438759.1 hypothetical protein [Nostoc sp. FACHB-110]
MANSLANWQDALDTRLVNRLTRPLHQPGIMNLMMGQRIINRCDRFLHRLPLLNQQIQRWGSTNTLSSESVPIVYAQPTNLVQAQPGENGLNSPISTNTIIQRKLDTTESLPMTKFISTAHSLDTTNSFVDSKTQIHQADTPLVSSQLTSINHAPSEVALTDNPTPVFIQNTESNLFNQKVIATTDSQIITNQPINNIERQLQNSSTSQSFLSINTKSNHLNKKVLAASDSTIITPQSITRLEQQLIPIIQAKLQNNSQSQSSIPIANKLNLLSNNRSITSGNDKENYLASTANLSNVQTTFPTPSKLDIKPGWNINSSLDELNSPLPKNGLNQNAIAASQNPVVKPLPITDIEHLILNSYTSQTLVNYPPKSSGDYAENFPVIRQKNTITEIATEQLPIVTAQTITNQTHSQKNINPLPLTIVIPTNHTPLKPKSAPLPLAKITSSSKSNSQPVNHHPTSNTDYSSPPRSITPPVSSTKTSVSSITTKNTDIDIDAIASQVERKLMRRIVIESERRGKNR